MVRISKGKFIRIVCVRCGQKKITFGKASLRVKCDGCNKLLLKTSGGKVRIRAVVQEVL
jgi:ribosomal protein S27E